MTRLSTCATADQLHRADVLSDAGRSFDRAAAFAREAAAQLRAGTEPRGLTASSADVGRLGLGRLGEASGVITSPCIACLADGDEAVEGVTA